MNPLKRLESELAGFMLFGGLMTADLRKLTAELLFRHLYEASFDAKAVLAHSTIIRTHPHWAKLLQKLFDQPSLNRLTRNNEDFALSVTKETLDWCKKTYKKFEQNSPLFDEYQQLNNVKEELANLPYPHWNDLLTELTKNYPENAQTWAFYQKRLNSLNQEHLQEVSKEGEKTLAISDFQLLKENIVDDWHKLFIRKKLELEEGFLKDSFNTYYKSLSHKVEQLNSLGVHLRPYYNFLGMSWNTSLDNWNQIKWDELEAFAYTLHKDRELRELAELLGRFHVSASYMKEQARLQATEDHDWKPNPYGKSEIIGITQSDQLSAVLPMEIAFISHPETEIVFDKKFIEKKLLTFQYRSHDMSSSEAKEKIISDQSHDEEKGPIILCIDTSGSMFGYPERIAKALAFAILEIALKEKRQAYLISFSTDIQTTEMTGMEEDLSRLIAFLKMSFHGGTDLQPALKKAAEKIHTEAYKHADVLVISDFIIPRLDRSLLDLIQEARETYSTHFHSLYITRRPDPKNTPLALFDNHWIYDLNNPSVIRQSLVNLQTLI